MKFKTFHNIEVKDNVLTCNQSSGIAVSNFTIEFEENILLLDRDHCECIYSIIESVKNELICKLITDKKDVDEFIILTIQVGTKKQILKLKYIKP